MSLKPRCTATSSPGKETNDPQYQQTRVYREIVAMRIMAVRG
jgi:hypothetical protein